MAGAIDGEAVRVPVGAVRRRRSSGGGRGEGGAYAGSPAGVRRTEARARGDWREAGGSGVPRILELGIQNVYKGKNFTIKRLIFGMYSAL